MGLWERLLSHGPPSRRSKREEQSVERVYRDVEVAPRASSCLVCLSAGKVETVQNLVFNVSYTFKKHNSSGYRKKMKWKQRHTGGRSLFSLLASIDKIGLSNVCDNFQQLPLSFCASPPWSLDSTHPVASCGRPAPGRRARGAGAGALAGSRPAGGVCLCGLRRAGPGPQ